MLITGKMINIFRTMIELIIDEDERMKKIKYIIVFIITLILLSQVSALMQNPLDDMSEKTSLLPKIDETVWWNTTELSTESYTAPFFEVYKLKEHGHSAYGLDVADFNDDGLLDFIVSWTTKPDTGISIFYGDHERSFIVKDIKFYEFPIEDLDLADFDGDGDLDIMCARVLEGINVEYPVSIIWNENNTFENEVEVARFNRSSGYWINPHISVSDFDQDGDVDFIVGANCGKVKLFKNNGTGFFTDEGVIFDYGDNSWGLDTADFNNDGYPDFIVCARTDPDEYPFGDVGHIYLKLNDRSDRCFNSSDPGILITSIPFPFDYTIGAAEFGNVAVLDYNNDGLLDVLYAGDYKIFLLIQQFDGSFSPFYAVGLRGRELDWSDRLREGGFAIGDFNYDGYDDVVAGGVQGDVRLLINNQTFVNIVKPEDRLLYFFGKDDHQLKFPGMKVIVGSIEVVAKGLEPLGRVDFYVDDILVKSDESEPFSWNWTRFGFREYKVTAEAYDSNGEFAGRDIIWVWKFL
jgi:hypothetical protein